MLQGVPDVEVQCPGPWVSLQHHLRCLQWHVHIFRALSVAVRCMKSPHDTGKIRTADDNPAETRYSCRVTDTVHNNRGWRKGDEKRFSGRELLHLSDLAWV